MISEGMTSLGQSKNINVLAVDNAVCMGRRGVGVRDDILMPLGNIGVAFGVGVDGRYVAMRCRGIAVGVGVGVGQNDIYVRHL